jgi:hypothetical protein
MPAAPSGAIVPMRRKLTRASLEALMDRLARDARKGRHYRVFLVGGGTAILQGWRESTIDADLYAEHDEIFRDIQQIKEQLEINVEFARPEDFVPPLAGSGDRHVFIRSIGNVGFYHYDPYAQVLSKIVRGFARDLDDARAFLAGGMVDAETFRALVYGIPEATYAKYPALSAAAVREAVDAFLSEQA